MQKPSSLPRKLFIILALGLGFLATDLIVKPAQARICCSACDADPIPLPCYSGCSPSC